MCVRACAGWGAGGWPTHLVLAPQDIIVVDGTTWPVDADGVVEPFLRVMRLCACLEPIGVALGLPANRFEYICNVLGQVLGAPTGW